MNVSVGHAQIGQWYRHLDKGESFLVTGYDDESRTIEIQSFDGDLDEIEEEAWAAMPLALAEQPEDWTGPVDDVEVDDLGYSETDMKGSDWREPLQPFRASKEAWEDTAEAEDVALQVQGTPTEDLTVDNVAARDLEQASAVSKGSAASKGSDKKG